MKNKIFCVGTPARRLGKGGAVYTVETGAVFIFFGQDQARAGS